MHESPEELKNRQQAMGRLSREGKKFFKFIEFDAKEELVMEIRKHPFGLFLILLSGAFVILALFATLVAIGTFNFGEELGVEQLNTYRPVAAIIMFLILLGTAIMTFIGAFLYISNVIYVTSEKIAQVLYLSLFNRKISQLSIGDVQDVTVSQKGIFAHFFGYGTLVIETAGEQQNYTFSYVPDPYTAARQIVGSHERNLELHGN